MGYAARMNPNSNWNKRRNSAAVQEEQILNTVSTPVKDEPMIIELTNRNFFLLIKDFLWRTLKPLMPTRKQALSQKPTS